MGGELVGPACVGVDYERGHAHAAQAKNQGRQKKGVGCDFGIGIPDEAQVADNHADTAGKRHRLHGVEYIFDFVAHQVQSMGTGILDFLPELGRRLVDHFDPPNQDEAFQQPSDGAFDGLVGIGFFGFVRAHGDAVMAKALADFVSLGLENHFRDLLGGGVVGGDKHDRRQEATGEAAGEWTARG